MRFTSLLAPDIQAVTRFQEGDEVRVVRTWGELDPPPGDTSGQRDTPGLKAAGTVLRINRMLRNCYADDWAMLDGQGAYIPTRCLELA